MKEKQYEIHDLTRCIIIVASSSEDCDEEYKSAVKACEDHGELITMGHIIVRPV